ncbi:MAG TPA: LptF/LptG family permease [Longimicrobiales bacterium]
MRILTRYILRAHLGPFFFALTALTSILLINTIARQLESLAGKGLPTSVFVQVFLYSMPHVVALTVPMAVLVAVLYTFSQLSAENEITALKASGVNLHRLMAPVLIGATVLAAGMVEFYDKVLPDANHRLANLYIDVARKAPTLQLKEQVINEISTQDMRSKYYLQAGTIDAATNKMRDVVIYDLSDPGRSRTIYADSGRMAFNRDRTDLFLDLHRGWVNEGDVVRQHQFQRTFFADYRLRVKGVGNKLEHSTDAYRSDREMSIGALQDGIRSRRKELAGIYASADTVARKAVKQTTEGAGVPGLPRPILLPPSTGMVPVDPPNFKPTDEVVRQTALQLRVLRDRAAAIEDQVDSYLVEYHKKFSIPFASIVFVLIGAPLALRFPRGGTGTVIAISLAIFGIYYVGLIGGETLSDKGYLSPFVAMWAANIVFLLLSVYGVATIGHERSNARGGTWEDVLYIVRETVLRPFRRLRGRRRARGARPAAAAAAGR